MDPGTEKELLRLVFHPSPVPSDLKEGDVRARFQHCADIVCSRLAKRGTARGSKRAAEDALGAPAKRQSRDEKKGASSQQGFDNAMKLHYDTHGRQVALFPELSLSCS
jgi:hypothetical protein